MQSSDNNQHQFSYLWQIKKNIYYTSYRLCQSNYRRDAISNLN